MRLFKSTFTESPAVTEVVRIAAVDVEAAFAIPHQGRHAVHATLQQHLDCVSAQLRPVKAVEQDRPAAALRMAHFACEDGRLGRLVASFRREVRIADALDRNLAERVRSAAEHFVAGRIRRDDRDPSVAFPSRTAALKSSRSCSPLATDGGCRHLM